MLFEARMTARVQAAIFEVNRNRKKRSKPITEQDFLPPEPKLTGDGPSDEELVAKIKQAFGVG